MEMPEGWKRTFEIGYDCEAELDPLEQYGLDHKQIGQLTREMAEALDEAIGIIDIYIADTIIIMKKRDDAKQIAKERNKFRTVLKKFKEWK